MSRLSIRARLITVLFVLVGLGVLAQAYGFAINTRDIGSLRDRAGALLELASEGRDVESAVRAQHDAVDAYLMTSDASELDAYRAGQTSEARSAGAAEDIAGQFSGMSADLAAIRDATATWRTQFADQALALTMAGKPLTTYAPTLERTGIELFAKVKSLQDKYELDLAALYGEAETTLAHGVETQATVFGLSVAGVALGELAAIFLMTRWITRPMGALLATAKRVRDGEPVSFPASGDDEIGRLGGELERMRSTLYAQTNEAGVVNRFTELTAFMEADGDVARATLDALDELTEPDDGAIHISNRSRDRAVPEASIGEAELGVVGLGQLAMCPGVRRSSLYVSDDLAGRLAVRCPLHPASSGTLACIPLIALGDVIGAVHLHWAEAGALPLEVRGAVTRITEHASLAMATRRLVVALQGQASTDSRTGLPNSRSFDEALERGLSARSTLDPLAVLMLDVDHFKQFNDRNGHPAGDQALRTFAAILASSIREGDIAARYGGEEFVVMLPGASAEDASLVAERIRKRTEQTVIDLSPGHRDRITVSIGIAVFPDDASSRVALLEAADAALYRAKRNGRNQVMLASEVVEPRAGEVAHAEAEIAAAVAVAQAEVEVGGAAEGKPRPLRLPKAG